MTDWMHEHEMAVQKTEEECERLREENEKQRQRIDEYIRTFRVIRGIASQPLKDNTLRDKLRRIWEITGNILK